LIISSFKEHLQQILTRRQQSVQIGNDSLAT
jgi:hypothetical protein